MCFYEKAYNIMTSPQAKQAFDIEREPEKTREGYGMTSMGQCCLLARRLVEAGCRFVSIENGHWDTHRKNTYSLRDLLCPSFDQAIPALLNDLSDRGMLEKYAGRRHNRIRSDTSHQSTGRSRSLAQCLFNPDVRGRAKNRFNARKN